MDESGKNARKSILFPLYSAFPSFASKIEKRKKKVASSRQGSANIEKLSVGDEMVQRCVVKSRSDRVSFIYFFLD